MEILTGVSAKLDRAATHLEAIDAAVHEFVEVDLNNAKDFTSVNALDRKWQMVHWRRVPRVGPEIGTVLGDFAHNVRSALDQLIWELVRANNGKPKNHTQWPMAETEGKWLDDVVNRNVVERGLPPTEGLSEKALQLVHDHQPFATRLGAASPLFRLHRISNEDKHRTLHVGYPFLTEGPTNVRFEPRGHLAITKLQKPKTPPVIKDGAPFIRMKIRQVVWPPPEGVDVQMQFDDMGIHLGFFAGDRHIAALDHLHPMLDVARSILATALDLPEVLAAEALDGPSADE